MEVGEVVGILGDNGVYVPATFDGAADDRLTFTPIRTPKPRCFLWISDDVALLTGGRKSIRAKVMDNRNEKIVLKTVQSVTA